MLGLRFAVMSAWLSPGSVRLTPPLTLSSSIDPEAAGAVPGSLQSSRSQTRSASSL